MSDAFIEGLGTSVVAILIVFIVLSALWFVLYLLKYVNMFVNKYEAKKNKEVQKTKNTNAPISVETGQELDKENGDTELVAVITAAIAASLGTTTDKFLVKSITKVQNWNSIARREQQRNII